MRPIRRDPAVVQDKARAMTGTTLNWLLLTEDELQALARGEVPTTVQAMAAQLSTDPCQLCGTEEPIP